MKVEINASNRDKIISNIDKILAKSEQKKSKMTDRERLEEIKSRGIPDANGVIWYNHNLFMSTEIGWLLDLASAFVELREELESGKFLVRWIETRPLVTEAVEGASSFHKHLLHRLESTPAGQKKEEK